MHRWAAEVVQGLSFTRGVPLALLAALRFKFKKQTNLTGKKCSVRGCKNMGTHVSHGPGSQGLTPLQVSSTALEPESCLQLLRAVA